MRMPEYHRRLLEDALAVGRPFGLALMGGYAVQAHGIVSRPSQDLDFATEHRATLEEIIGSLTGGLSARGWQITLIDVTPLKARFIAADSATGEACEVDVLKEVLWRPPVALLDIGPVLDLEDLVGTKVCALGDRGLARDAVDVHAARHLYSTADMERLGARRPDGFDLQELHDRLESIEWISDAEFEAYGLDATRIRELRSWAQEWLDDLAQRLAAQYEEPDPD
ncbi:nucleotidyl transferase AbiEii/AbiGii toxin family protein [Streptomyces spongiae]|uniref:Nucleotidyl transferase AbiEii/AbiGii toxin family protein n=1 Tax=Streptomyces spongiae TaxID=565072 RepID=A0A5N8XD23_9ACTN|nr:nucleotidyl transferase AbiEii/AbiGii toxin family protein [Streptomyces spongiae]MPY56798.1 nucleotidyl transferase AbiEii/AbiGii toxin family protein [Streptomyces spongiae]